MRPFSYPRVMLLSLATATLAACQPVWVKSGEAEREFSVATTECDSITRRGYFGTWLVGEMNKQAFFDRCIAEHGYRQVDPRQVPEGARAHAVVAPGGFHAYPSARN